VTLCPASFRFCAVSLTALAHAGLVWSHQPARRFSTRISPSRTLTAPSSIQYPIFSLFGNSTSFHSSGINVSPPHSLLDPWMSLDIAPAANAKSSTFLAIGPTTALTPSNPLVGLLCPPVGHRLCTPFRPHVPVYVDYRQLFCG
jgi:hypothetical protein